MKLKSVEIQNYRSITKTTKLQLDSGLTVILGPNNEGKSNLLRAIVVALDCLREIRDKPPTTFRRLKESVPIGLPPEIYDWASDFPLAAQKSKPEGESSFFMEFELNPVEQKLFRDELKSTINQNLPIEICIGSQGARFRVKKQGKGAKQYDAKSGQIAQFISKRFEIQYIPAIRPSELSLGVIGNMVERELTILSKDTDYQSAMKTIEELQKPVLKQLSLDVQTHLKTLLPSIKAVQININPVYGGTYRTRYHAPQFIVDDGTPTLLEAKGDGIKSLAAISLMRASRAGETAGDVVVAIEEPESHLHPEAIRQLSTMLADMATKHQVIITTHSPLLVARTRLGANIIVSKSKATPASNIKAVRQSLGVKVQDNLEWAEYFVVVEGETDIAILSSVFATLCPEFKNLHQKGVVAFDHLNGASNIPYKISTIKSMAGTPIIVFDGDKAGQRNGEKATKDGNIDERYIFYCKRPGNTESEIEDMIDPNFYWSRIMDEFGAKLDQSVFDDCGEKWSIRIEKTFTAAGKGWSKSTESNLKKIIADLVKRDPSNAVAADKAGLLKAIAEAIVQIVDRRS